MNEHEHSGTSIIHFYLHSMYMTTCIVHSPDDKCPLAPLAYRAASVDTPTPSPYATDSRSFQLPITVPWHHGSNHVTCVEMIVHTVKLLSIIW